VTGLKKVIGGYHRPLHNLRPLLNLRSGSVREVVARLAYHVCEIIALPQAAAAASCLDQASAGRTCAGRWPSVEEQ
jgi:hypothetical protein